jgi:hypothetical protein
MMWVMTMSIAGIALMVLLSPVVVPAGQRCSSCHTAPNPAGGYEFRMPLLELVCPATVPPNATFSVLLELSHPGSYTVKEPLASLNLTADGRSTPVQYETGSFPSISSSGGTISMNWTVAAGNATGTLRLNATVGFTARYSHTDNHDGDENRYVLVRYSTIDIRPVAVYSTAGHLALPATAKKIATFELVSVSRTQNLTISASPNLVRALTVSPASIASMEPGQRCTVNLTVVNGSVPIDNGRVDIVWENETGARDSSFVLVSIKAPSPGRVEAAMSPLVLTGRITGILSLSLLLTSLALGLAKKGGARRVRVHCAVSWFLLGLGLYHGLMLVWGPYSRIMWSNFLLLGYASATMMGASGVNGLLHRWMSRKAGHRTWIWVHRITIIVAVVLVTIHAMAIGTDFAFLRGSSGGA